MPIYGGGNRASWKGFIEKPNLSANITILRFDHFRGMEWEIHVINVID